MNAAAAGTPKKKAQLARARDVMLTDTLILWREAGFHFRAHFAARLPTARRDGEAAGDFDGGGMVSFSFCFSSSIQRWALLGAQTRGRLLELNPVPIP